MGREEFRPGNHLYPVPVVMVSCQKKGEKPNIITVAWCGTTSSDPATLYISVRPERYSYEIIKETGEFVVNLVNEKITRACDFCGVKSGRDVDKYSKTGLTPLESKHVLAPGIAESPVCIECRVRQTIDLGSHVMFLADVLGASVDDTYMDENGRFDLNASGLVAYSHGAYCGLKEAIGTFGYSVRKKKK